MSQTPTTSLYLFEPPYRELSRLRRDWPRKTAGRAVLWTMGKGRWRASFDMCRSRPAGIALIVILPPAVDISRNPDVLRVVEQCRPHSILPYHPEPHVDDLATILRREPADLPIEVMEYVQWRGILVDMETRHLIRRTIALSAEIKTVSALARSLYMSRRALGRRFQTRGIPVPSHWLQFGRILRAALRLQTTDKGLASIAYEMGYPDGFVLSNQMDRLAGVRPKRVRRNLGWEWIVETWLQKESRQGGISTTLHRRFKTLSRSALDEAHQVSHLRVAESDGPSPDGSGVPPKARA